MRRFTVVDVPQRSPEWFQARLGRLTGSVADKMLATVQKGEAAGRRDLRTRLVLERLTGRSGESDYVNADMQWGIDHEDDALAAYEALTGEIVTRTGFCQHTEHMAGCSLDGHLGDFKTLVSIKCPRSANHLANLRAGELPSNYKPQALHEMWLTGAEEYHFLSFDPRFPDKFRVCFVRVERPQILIDDYEKKVRAFLAEVDAELQALQTMNNLSGQLAASL